MRSSAFVAAMVVASLTWSAPGIANPDCRTSRELLDLGHPLPVARDAVANSRTLRIVAMGSSSTQGYGTTLPQYAYPAQLKMRLDAAMPGVSVHVFNKGIGGQDAEEMTDRMKSDVQPQRAHLVVWQVGTNSAIRHTPLEKFARKLRAGIDIGKSLGAEFILMNLQYVPAVVALPDEQDYARVMAEVAKEKGAGLFNRLAIMKGWYNDGMPYSQFVYNDGLHLNDFGQKCVGKLLSMAILRAVKPSQLTGDPKAGN
ncbi:MAG: SGNH/GDSL hydrolase family protein [Proteobacteria bacterium]|nr:SGNH/GDSL hydrolase family protein [Pseudomonadota bacterium]